MNKEHSSGLVKEFIWRIVTNQGKVVITWIVPKKESQEGTLLFQNNSFWILLPDGTQILIPPAETSLNSSAEILTVSGRYSDRTAFEFTIKHFPSNLETLIKNYYVKVSCSSLATCSCFGTLSQKINGEFALLTKIESVKKFRREIIFASEDLIESGDGIFRTERTNSKGVKMEIKLRNLSPKETSLITLMLKNRNQVQITLFSDKKTFPGKLFYRKGIFYLEDMERSFRYSFLLEKVGAWDDNAVFIPGERSACGSGLEIKAVSTGKTN